MAARECGSNGTCTDTGPARAVMHNLALEGLLDGGLKFRPMTLPDRFIEHGGQADQLAEAGLSASHIAATALTLLGRKKDSVALLENGWTARV